jgi:hypothetical protein
MKYFLFICLGLLMSCTPSSATWDVDTTQSPARVVKVGEVVTIYSSFAVRENLLYSSNTWNPNAPQTRVDLLTNYTIKGFVYGQNDPNGLPYANPVGVSDGFIQKSSNPADYPFPPEADLITPTMSATRIPELIDATFDPISNRVSSSYSMKIIGDGKPVPPPISGAGYDVYAQTGFVIFPKNIEAIPANWDKAFVIGYSRYASVRIGY